MKDHLLKLFNTNDLIEKINAGFEIATLSASYADTIECLKSDDADVINAAILKISKVKNQEDAFVLISKLVGTETKIREITSFRILDFIKDEKMNIFFQPKEVLTILLKALDDVNPAICRNVISSFEFVEDKKYLIEKIINKINVLTDEIYQIKDIKNRDNNKKIFNLYWNLQALVFLSANFKKEVEPFQKEITEIIQKNKSCLSYQIREKSALICFNILSFAQNQELLDLKEHFKSDENFYVRRIFIL